MSSYEQMSLKDAIHNRRTVYSLQKTSAVPDSRIRELLADAIKHVPSSFNSQSTRLVALLKDDHDKFWDIVGGILKSMVPEEQWQSTSQRIQMFKGGYGTILFYEDPAPVKALQEKYPMYADKFPQWSDHTSAMHQYALWTGLESEGLGANLQHYNPLPDQKVSEVWKVPQEWSLKAQMVFGDPSPGDDGKRAVMSKDFQPVEERLFIHGA